MLIPALTRDQRRPVTTLSLVIGTLALMALGHVWTQLRTIEYGYGFARASRLHARLVEANRRLRTELAMLKSPGRLTALAQTDLGLAAPEPGQLRRLGRSADASWAARRLDRLPGTLVAQAQPREAQAGGPGGVAAGARGRRGSPGTAVTAPLGLLWSSASRRGGGHRF